MPIGSAQYVALASRRRRSTLWRWPAQRRQVGYVESRPRTIVPSAGDRQRRWKLEQRRSSCRSNCRTIVVGTSEVARTTDRKGLLILSKELPPLRAGIFLFLLMPLRQCIMAAIQMRRRVRNLYRSLVERAVDRANVIPEITRHRLTVETPPAAGTSKSFRAPLPIR